MKKTVHRADSRGFVDHGWLKSHHTFSFASYMNRERMRFGLLRVINDDFIEASMGFDTHQHKDMEIVTVPLSGSLRHKDSEGNEAVIQHGEVQAMSAGTGVFHSEYNASDNEPVTLLQIWVLPEKLGIAPRYDQKKFSEDERKNNFQEIVAPIGSDSGAVEINQQAYFLLVDLDNGHSVSYELKNLNHGLYLFVIDGEVEAAGEKLSRRDAIGIESISAIEITANSDSQLLTIEVPLN